jgi:hypothetical protein
MQTIEAVETASDLNHLLAATSTSQSGTEPQTTTFPPFPAEIICGAARAFIDLYAGIRETPEQFLWLAFITYLGNAISPYVSLTVDYSEPRLFGAAVGRSARTKKSSANNLAKTFFRETLGEEQQIIEGFGSAEGLLDALQDQPKPTIVHLDEINILAQKGSMEGSVGTAALHKLFEDLDYDHTLSQGKGYRIRDAHLSLIGASTLDDFTAAWSSKQANAGFFSRLLIVGADEPVNRVALPKRPDEAAYRALVEEIRAVYAGLRQKPLAIPLEPAAEEAWYKFYASFGEGKEWDRIDTYGLRLMTLVAVLHGCQPVTKEDVERVIAFLQYEVAVRRLAQPIIADNSMAELEQKIRRYVPEAPEWIKYRDLGRKVHSERTGVWMYTKALENLTKEGEIQRRKEGTSELISRVVQ